MFYPLFSVAFWIREEVSCYAAGAVNRNPVKDNLSLHNDLGVAGSEILSVPHLPESSHGGICFKQNKDSGVFNLSGSARYKESQCSRGQRERTLFWVWIGVQFSCCLENSWLAEDFDNRILFCALAGERGNDFRVF